MADSKLQELDAITSPQDSDLLYVVRNENGTYTDNKITKANLVGTVPTKTSDITNDSGFITAEDVTVPTDISELTDSTGVIPNDVSDLTDSTGVIPSDVSELTDTTGVIPDDISANVLLKDNTTEFTPDADYEPATKKYVDDNAGGEVVDRITQHYSFSDYATTDTIWYQTMTNSSCIPTGNDTYGGLKCTLGGTTNDRLRLALTLKEPKIFDRNPMISIQFHSLNQYNAPALLSLGSNTNTGSHLKRIGWRWNADNEIYASNGDGSTAKETKLDTTFGAGVKRELTIKMTSGTDVKYYVDGVLKATHTQNLPTGDGSGMLFTYDVLRNFQNSSVDFWLSNLVISYDAVIPT